MKNSNKGNLHFGDFRIVYLSELEDIRQRRNECKKVKRNDLQAVKKAKKNSVEVDKIEKDIIALEEKIETLESEMRSMIVDLIKSKEFSKNEEQKAIDELQSKGKTGEEIKIHQEKIETLESEITWIKKFDVSSGLKALEQSKNGGKKQQESGKEQKTEETDPPKPMPRTKPNLIGLTLSGGGIRSATFNLGLLQGLCNNGMLEKVDILSTVSGGGYIGTCMTTLLNSGDDSIGTSPDTFPLGRERSEESGEPTKEKEPVRQLRYFSNYLTAESGYFRPAMVFVRGLVLNFSLLVPCIILAGLLLAFVFNIRTLGAKEFFFLFDYNEFKHVLKISNDNYSRAADEMRRYAANKTSDLSFDSDQERIEWVARTYGSDETFKALEKDTKDAKKPLEEEWHRIWYLPGGFFVLMIAVALLFKIFYRLSYQWRLRFSMSLTWLFTISLALAALNLYGVLIVYWKSWEISAWIASVSLFSFIAPKLLKTGTGNGGTGKKMFIKIALAIGLLLLVPILILYLVGGIIAYVSSENSQILGLIVAALVLACINWRFINLNEISLHNYYRDCLSRAYMMFYDSKHGDISHGDKLKFSELDPGKSPYHIINTTLNLKKEMPVNKGKGVFRTGESFVFTKNWCGSDNTGYIHTEQYERYDRHVNVGTAMAISGAAANIGMAQKNIFVLRLLMGLFNIRLGYWALNPGNTKRLILRGYPGSLEVLRESLGNYKLDSHYINLSDGGHFDNIGVYELLRRRCKYIIVGDAEADPEMKFEAISYIMRLARIDFGIEIRIDPSDIKPDRETGFSRSHCVVGRIDYPEGDFGYLLYCKASLSGDEPEHLYEYRVKHPQFPHQTTADQWFDEQQFEAYRELGYHVGREAFAPVAGTEISDNEELFNALKESWHPHSEAIENQFTKHTVELNRIVSDLKNDKDLKFMDAQMYPEWDQLIPPLTEPQHSESERPHSYLWLPKRNKEIRKGFYLCNLMMQLMENVYTDLNLESEHAHPDNRGWMNLFRHWSWSGMFRVSWAISACTFGARFQKFCEKHLELDLGKISVRKRDDVDVAVDDELNPYEQKVVLNFKQDGKYLFVSLYVLELKVRNPLDSKNDKTFHFGFALVNAEKELVYFRVQDHLRQMGLGKTALKKLKTHPDDDIKIAKFSGELLKFLLAEKESLAEAEEDTDAIPIDVQDLVSFERMCKQVGLS